jgi:hypothetical protein
MTQHVDRSICDSIVCSKVFARQIQNKSTKKLNQQSKNEKLSANSKNQQTSIRSETYLLTMLPVDKGEHVFNSHDGQEWQLLRDTDTKFAIYGMLSR